MSNCEDTFVIFGMYFLFIASGVVIVGAFLDDVMYWIRKDRQG